MVFNMIHGGVMLKCLMPYQMARLLGLIANFSLNTFNLIDNYVQINAHSKLEEKKI